MFPVAAISAELKRLFIRGLKWDSEESGATLAATLKAAARAKLKSTQTGLVLVSVSSRGHSTEYQLPQGGAGFTPTNLAELCEEMLNTYDRAKADIIASGTASPTDDQIFSEMIRWIEPVTEVYSDFSMLRGGGF